MESFENYLVGEYRDIKQEIERIQKITSDVTRVFIDFFTDDGEEGGQWPYEVFDYRTEQAKKKLDPQPKPKGGSSYSSSTNAMIMFTLCVLWGKIQKSPLLPNVFLHPLGEIENLDLELRNVLRKAFRKLGTFKPKERRGRDKDIITYSPTFGANDPFTLCWFLEIFDVLSEMVPEIAGELQILHQELLDSAGLLVKSVAPGPNQSILSWRGKKKFRRASEHIFPLLRTIQLFKVIKDKMNVEINVETIQLIHRYFLDCLHRHLSYSSVPDIGFDAAELVFSLEGALLCNPEARNEILINRVFQLLADRQGQSPYWQAQKPFVATPAGDSLMPLSVEIANSFLRICFSLETNALQNTYIVKNIALFRQYANWLGYRMVQGIADWPLSKPDGKRRFVGWVSEHTPAPGTIHLWETSQVLLFLAHYRLMLDQYLAQTTLQRANLSVKVSSLDGADWWSGKDLSSGLKPDPRKYWETVEGKYEALKGLSADSEYRIYRRIYENYIVPWTAFSKNEPIMQDRHYSMLLYGPPGTAKTTLAREIARTLEYPLIEITPSDFIAGGETEVEARAKAIFKSLEEQSKVVILFDEIDRMILDRDSKLYLDQSDVFQFMTPGMLTKLKDLHDKKRSIFIIATNLAERIDKAAKRQGRIDDHYIVLPPDEAKRHGILKGLFQKYLKECDQNSDKELADVIREVAHKTALFVFDELDQLVHSAVHLVHGAADPDRMSKLRGSIIEGIGKVDPTITLTSYQSRFRATAKKPSGELSTAQEPFEEFFLLVSLVIEVRGLSPEEESLVRMIPGGDSGHPLSKQYVRDGILKQVKDESIKKSLIEKLIELGICA